MHPGEHQVQRQDTQLHRHHKADEQISLQKALAAEPVLRHTVGQCGRNGKQQHQRKADQHNAVEDVFPEAFLHKYAQIVVERRLLWEAYQIVYKLQLGLERGNHRVSDKEDRDQRIHDQQYGQHGFDRPAAAAHVERIVFSHTVASLSPASASGSGWSPATQSE